MFKILKYYNFNHVDIIFADVIFLKEFNVIINSNHPFS